MHQVLYPALFALFVWWFSTGVIIFLDQLPARTFRYSMAGATLVLGGALWGMSVSAGDSSVTGAYCGFTCGLLAWGWQEMSFYMGFITGPRRQACGHGCGGWKHFIHAVQTTIWHELAILSGAVLLASITWHQPNHVGLWTYLVLWAMQISAKLNVFLGVRNLNEQFLPDHLKYLKGFLTQKPMNLLFPFSVTMATVAAVLFWEKVAAAGASAFGQAACTFLATMLTLAILEHWCLMLPLPFAALWKWGLALKSRQSGQAAGDAPGLASWSAPLEGECDTNALQTVLEAVLRGAYGPVERMKGVARAGAGWIRFDVAGGRSSMAAFAPEGADQAARVVAFGRHVDEEGLRAAFEACAA